jgi:curved DNA-binding protein CbpA
MAEANKDEADKCKKIAQSALSAGDCSKATRFLQKAKRMCPDDASIDALLEQAASGEGAGDGAGDSAGRRAASPARPAEGPRQRSAAATGSAGQGSAGNRTGKTGKAYTPEMMQQVQKVLRSKDYYDILGISKGSSEDEVKKAYKKLALKLHPDKNHAPGAEEAFKKVSKAVQCLTNVEAKQAYDRYGDEDHIPRQQRHQQDFMTPEDLFNAFFGGGTFHTGGGYQRQNVDPQDQAQAQRQQLFQVLPVLLIVFLSLVSNFGGQNSGSRFSLTPSAQYQNERTTAGINVPFYVTNDFEEHYGEGTRAMAEFEKQVEIYYVRNLHSECDYQEKVMYKKVMLAKRRGSSEELEKARNHPKPACNDLDKIKRKHANLYRSALYMGY